MEKKLNKYHIVYHFKNGTGQVFRADIYGPSREVAMRNYKNLTSRHKVIDKCVKAGK